MYNMFTHKSCILQWLFFFFFNFNFNNNTYADYIKIFWHLADWSRKDHNIIIWENYKYELFTRHTSPCNNTVVNVPKREVAIFERVRLAFLTSDRNLRLLFTTKCTMTKLIQRVGIFGGFDEKLHNNIKYSDIYIVRVSSPYIGNYSIII